MFRLSWKVGGALLVVVLIAVGIMAFLINQNVNTEFRNYVQHGNLMYTQRLTVDLARHYDQYNNWKGVKDVLQDSIRSDDDRLVLADASGKIIADTDVEWEGESSSGLNLDNGISIDSSGQTIGTLYVFSSSFAAGRGHMGGRGMMGENNTGNEPANRLVSAELDFLSRTNNYLWIAGSIAFVIAILLGLLLTRQITRPLRALTAGALEISRGNLGYRFKVKTRDELGELGQSFNTMAINLDKSEQARKRLVSDVTHELRTPLTIIEGTVDGMLDGVFPADREHLNSIKEQTALLTHLVRDLRDLSLAESGRLNLELTSVNMTDMVRRKLSQFEPAAKGKGIQLKLKTDLDVPEVKADVMRIDQVLTNLLSNALHHSPGGGTITVRLISEANLNHAGKPELIISVTDTGEGIPEEHIPHLFERFYKVEDSRTRSEGGAGLGLAIVKQMVQAHGGRVWAESEPGKGSTFYITLPLPDNK